MKQQLGPEWIIAAIGTVFAAVVITSVVVALTGDSSGDQASPTPTTTTSTSRAPYPEKRIPGDGYHKIGGLEGKYWASGGRQAHHSSVSGLSASSAPTRPR